MKEICQVDVFDQVYNSLISEMSRAFTKMCRVFRNSFLDNYFGCRDTKCWESKINTCFKTIDFLKSLSNKLPLDALSKIYKDPS